MVTAVIALSCAGCGGGGEPAGDATPPTITAVRADVPIGFNFTGGNVAVSASVTDNVAVASVRTRVFKDGTELSPLGLTLKSGSTYGGVYAVPGNATAKAQTYSVRVWAQDTSGKTAESSSVSFSVPPAGGEIPPLPPAPGSR